MCVVIKHHDSQARRQLLFEKLRQAPTTSLTDFGYTGQRLDGSTGGLMYYGARYYLPELKRFISADTIVPSAYDSQALNRYAYVMNNPVKLVDPSGHLPYLQQPMIENAIAPSYVDTHPGSNYASQVTGPAPNTTPQTSQDDTGKTVQELAAALSGSNLNNWLTDNGYSASLDGMPCQTGASLIWYFAFEIPMDPGGDNDTYNPTNGWYFNITMDGGGVSQPFSSVESSFDYWTAIDQSLGSAIYNANRAGEALQFESDIRTGVLDVDIGDQVQFYGTVIDPVYGPYDKWKHVATVTGFDENGMPLLTDTGEPGLINQPISTYQNHICSNGALFDFSAIRVLHHPAAP